jgi:membrane glycosyltransferase
MDARVILDAAATAARALPVDTPPECPLAMPQQATAALRVRLAGETDGRWRLSALLIPASGVTLLAALQVFNAMNSDGMSAFEWLGLGLLVANLAWISAAAATAVAGAVILATRKPEQPRAAPPLNTASLTAILFPIRNEHPGRVTAGGQAVFDALARARVSGAFEIFFLSDTSDHDAAREEEAAIRRLRESRPEAQIFYRRRANNHGRKAGNISDFVRRWGGRYTYMAVFDADSLMSAEALVELVQRMDARPRTALIQTLPVIVNAQTLIARSQQFATRAYGQIFGTGLAWWSGGAGNFWGHNAILRVKAFAAHAGLPILPGAGPLGGHILSHDFVEAALLRRAGWRVEIAPEIDGSYEESPPTLDDMLARDRRWAQGNLQHLHLVGARGFDPVSRAHIVAGVMGYASALLWFSLVVTGVGLAWIAPPTAVHAGGPNLGLLALTALIVLSPKWLSLLLWAAGRLPGWRGHQGFVAGLITEAVVSAAIAPIMMISQTQAVLSAIAGRDAGWRPQARTGDKFCVNASQYAPHLAVGLALCAAMVADIGLAVWTAPVALSLVFASQISTALAHTPHRRSWLWRALATPEVLHPPAVVSAARRAAGRFNWETSTKLHASLPVIPAALAATRTPEVSEVRV